MALIRVDQEKCHRDGTCARVCPVGILALDAQKGPTVRRGMASLCIGCGHCVAACPHGALDHVRAPQAAQRPLERFPVVDPETALLFLRARRSIRCYRPEPVPQPVLEKLLQAARYAPSGHNSQGLSFTVVASPEAMDAVRRLVVQWMRRLVDSGSPLAAQWHMQGIVHAHDKGQDPILRNAPHLIVASAPQSHQAARVTSFLALEYVELYATSLGLGTCWAGYVQTCAMDQPDLGRLLELPEDHRITGCLMAGFPDVTYHRLPERNPLQVRWWPKAD
ncbi:nitroreductase family protein [Desulfosoma sp.]|uniref:nitroreductase family protein n=1 Tax=Desulfosoma sp. TaxID=2603217 RepID=UPI00404A7C5A